MAALSNDVHLKCIGLGTVIKKKEVLNTDDKANSPYKDVKKKKKKRINLQSVYGFIIKTVWARHPQAFGFKESILIESTTFLSVKSPSLNNFQVYSQFGASFALVQTNLDLLNLRLDLVQLQTCVCPTRLFPLQTLFRIKS